MAKEPSLRLVREVPVGTGDPRVPTGGIVRRALFSGAICGALGLAGIYVLNHMASGPIKPMAAALTASPAPAAAPARATKPPANQLVYRADGSGHFIVDAEVNGAPVRFLVDTGATFVALSPEDARAAGIARNSLRFTEAVSTANGVARAARTTLRDVRLNQLSVEGVAAWVMEEPLSISLLGMSFLSRLDGYSIHDGKLIIEW